MLYRFAWVLMWITFKIYFRRIDLIGVEKLNVDKPFILVANHPASFLDAMVLAVFLKRDLHFYVRGDIFKHPLALKVLNQLHMIPIFSREHGMENVGRNFYTFERGKRLLRSGKVLLIFPEGFSRLSKKIEPMKKGAARVALQTAFDEGAVKELTIQSVAINYSYHGLGSDLYIRVGDALQLDDYEPLYRESPAKAIGNLTADLNPFFEKNVIHVQEHSKTLIAEEVLRMLYNDCIDRPAAFFEKARTLCKKIDEIIDQEYDGYVHKMNEYRSLLNKNELIDRSFSRNNPPHIMSLLNLLLTIEFYVFGKLFWYLPGKLSKWIADKTVTRIDFYTSVFTGVLAFVCLLWWISWLLFVLQWDMFILKVMVSCAPFLAYIAVQWEFDFKDLLSDYRLKQIKKNNPSLVEHMVQLREKVIAQSF